MFTQLSPCLNLLARIASYTVSSLFVQATCVTNTESRKLVKYPGATGSRSYEVSRNGEEDPFELFKKTHISPNPDNAYSGNVKMTIVSPPKFCNLMHVLQMTCAVFIP